MQSQTPSTPGHAPTIAELRANPDALLSAYARLVTQNSALKAALLRKEQELADVARSVLLVFDSEQRPVRRVFTGEYARSGDGKVLTLAYGEHPRV